MRAVSQRQVALPQEHGAWVFLLGPLLIGISAAERTTPGTLALIAAALAAFLLRQPISMAVKALSGRRARAYLRPALLWTTLYSLVGFAATAALVIQGHTPVVILAVPALSVMTWHLWLLSRRQERRKPHIEILGSGALGLAAPAALWVGLGKYDPLGWELWILAWLQSATSILYAYARLAQRDLKTPVPARRLWSGGAVGLAAAAGSVLVSWTAGMFEPRLRWVALAGMLQLAEVVWGTLHPALGWRPARIGVRQLVVSAAWTLVFIIAMRGGHA